MKTLIIAGNWKSNKTVHESRQWLEQFAQNMNEKTKQDGITIVLCAPFTVLDALKQEIEKLQLPISVGAQNVSAYEDGAYTGEISARMVHDLAQWVIIGHSERRTHQRETDEELHQKVTNAKAQGLQVIFCVPDSETAVPSTVDVIAYEPVWAIGTGKTDTPENANDVCGQIMKKTNISTVIYGGSVTDLNVASFVSMPNISGVLPGGASLDAEKFSRLLQAAGSSRI